MMTAKDKEISNVDTSEVIEAHHLLSKVGKAFNAKTLQAESKVVARIARRMSVLAEVAVGPGDVDEEDDEEGEGSGEKQTNGEAVVNLLNNCLGSGMCSVGFAFAQVGLVAGAFLLVASATLNRFTTHLNIKTCQMAKVDPATAEIGEYSFGILGRTVLVMMYTAVGFFCMVSYCAACADAVEGLMELVYPGSGFTHNQIMIGCWVFMLFPLTLPRSMKGVAVMSFLAFVGGLFLLLFVVILCSKTLVETGMPPFTQVKLFPNTVAEFLTAFPILILVFNIQAGGTMLLSTIEDPSEANQKKISAVGLSVAAIMDFILGGISYLTFLDTIEADVLNSFPAEDPVAVMARVAVLDLVVLSYVVMIIPCKLSLIDMLFGKNESKQEASLVEYYGITAILNVCALAFALTVSDLSIILGLCGAISGPFTAMLMPAGFYLVARSRTEEVSVFSPRNLTYHGLIIMGLFILVSCTYTVIQRMIAG